MRNTQACPLCREPSLHVYMASTFPSTQQHRDLIIRGARAEKKRTLCRDFEQSLRPTGQKYYYCPRFNDCPYAHLQPSEDPNKFVRRKPYIFTDAEIEQLINKRSAVAVRDFLRRLQQDSLISSSQV